MELLQGKTAIVTGGTRGIGLAVVRVFLQNGARVALFGSRQETADRAVAALKSEEPGWDVIGLAPDLTDFASVQAAVEAVRARFGGVDILVNNAGISAREPLADYKPEAFKAIMDLNVTAVFNGCKAVEPIMRAAGHGCIVNTSSMVSLYGQPSGVGYPASKFAVNGLTKSLAHGHGRSAAGGAGRADLRADPAAPHRRAGGGRQRLFVPGKRLGQLRDRNRRQRRRRGADLSTSNASRPEPSGRDFFADPVLLLPPDAIYWEAERKDHMKKKSVLPQLFFSTLYLSAFTFGGGYVIVSLMKKRFVDERHWIGEDEMLDLVAIAQSSPGPIAVNGAIVVGYKLAGLAGALTAAVATVIPPFVIIALVSYFYQLFRDNAVVSRVLSGMQAGVGAVIASVVWDMGADIARQKSVSSMLIMAAAFVLSCVCKVNVVYIVLGCIALGTARTLLGRRKAG